nr:hypothetical protein [Tanacetum cinerariifolium]
MLKPLPLILNNRGHRVLPFNHFINNDLEYLCGGASSCKYTTSVTKTKAADYEHIKWIKDLVPRTMWIQERIGYDKHALSGISHWGRKHQQFYGFAVNRESTRDVDDDKLYKFQEDDFKRLRIQDIEYMLLLLVQGKRKSDKDRAAAMIQAIDKRLKTRRIMRSLERSILTDLQVTLIKPGRMTKPYSSHRFIANCFNAGNLKIEVKDTKAYYDTTTGVSAHYSKTTSMLNAQIEVLGKQTAYTIQSVQHQLRLGHPNIVYYSDSDESDKDKPSEVLDIQKPIHSLSGNPTPSFDSMVESLSSPPTPFEDSDSLLEETDTLLSHSDDSVPDYETFCFDIKEKSTGSTTSHSTHSLLEYESFCFDVDHIEEKSNSSTTSYSNISLLEYE